MQDCNFPSIFPREEFSYFNRLEQLIEAEMDPRNIDERISSSGNNQYSDFAHNLSSLELPVRDDYGSMSSTRLADMIFSDSFIETKAENCKEERRDFKMVGRIIEKQTNRLVKANYTSLKKVFANDPDRKKEYAARASRRMREKKKAQRQRLIERNSELEKEQKTLLQKITALKKEVDSLERPNESSIPRSSLMVENCLLKEEVQQRRMIMQRVRQLLREVPLEAGNDKELLSISKLGVKLAASKILENCYASIENRGGEWKEIPYDFKNDQSLNQCRYFSQLENVRARVKHVAANVETNSAQKVFFRLDFIGIKHSEEVLKKALWKLCSRDDQFSLFRLFQQLYAEKSGIETHFRQLKISKEELDVSEFGSGSTDTEKDPPDASKRGIKRQRRWNLQDGKKQIVLSTVSEHIPEEVNASSFNFNGGLFIFANGPERIAKYGLDCYDTEARGASNRRGAALTEASQYVELPLISLSLVVPKKPEKFSSEKFLSEVFEKKKQEQLNTVSFFLGFIIHNLAGKKDSSNLTLILDTVVNDHVSAFVAKNTSEFQAQVEGNKGQKTQAPPLILCCLVTGLNKALEEILGESQ